MSLLSIPYVLLMNFLWINVEPRLMRLLWWGLRAKEFMLIEQFPLRSFEWFWRINYYLFSLWILRSVAFRLKLLNSDINWEIFMLGKRGVTIGIRAGRSVRPNRWVVVSCDGWILSLCFLINGYVLLCDHV
jgi:hypothetical protein